MGTWGYGILQNDSAQDSLAEVIRGIFRDILALKNKPSTPNTVARLGAGVGLLLQLSANYWFDPESRYWPELHEVLARHESAFASVSPEADRLLAAVLGGQGPELVSREAPPNARLGAALFATDSRGFPMERTFGLREPALFAHPEAAAYVQEVADRLVKEVDAGFADEDAVSDLCRESDFLGAFAVLLILEPCRVPDDRFAVWRARFRTVQERQGSHGDEQSFFDQYNACLEAAFRYGIDRFA